MRLFILLFLCSCATEKTLREKMLPLHLDIKLINGGKICDSFEPMVDCADIINLNGHYVVDSDSLEYLLMMNTLEGTKDDCKDNPTVETKREP